MSLSNTFEAVAAAASQNDSPIPSIMDTAFGVKHVLNKRDENEPFYKHAMEAFNQQNSQEEACRKSGLNGILNALAALPPDANGNKFHVSKNVRTGGQLIFEVHFGPYENAPDRYVNNAGFGNVWLAKRQMIELELNGTGATFTRADRIVKTERNGAQWEATNYTNPELASNLAQIINRQLKDWVNNARESSQPAPPLGRMSRPPRHRIR